MTRILGVEVTYYLKHKGKSESNVFKFIKLLRIFFWWILFACLVNTEGNFAYIARS